MDSGIKWTLVTVDGKISALSMDFAAFAEIAARIASLPAGCTNEICCKKIGTDEVMDLAKSVKWADLRLFGKDGLCLESSLDFGQFSLGKNLKKYLITHFPVRPR